MTLANEVVDKDKAQIIDIKLINVLPGTPSESVTIETFLATFSDKDETGTSFKALSYVPSRLSHRNKICQATCNGEPLPVPTVINGALLHFRNLSRPRASGWTHHVVDRKSLAARKLSPSLRHSCSGTLEEPSSRSGPSPLWAEMCWTYSDLLIVRYDQVTLGGSLIQ
jgi:hypothetical protein